MAWTIRYLSFTGQSGCYAAIPLDVLAGATTFTIEAKIATTSTISSSNNFAWQTIAGVEIGGNWQDDFGLCVNGGKFCFWSEPKSGGSSSTCNTTSNAVVNDGAIHEVAVVSSNGAIDLYCDGVNVAHTDNVNAKISASNQFFLGYNTNSSSYLQMDLYEIRFWNVARSAAEIFADIGNTETGLQGWYLPTADGLKDYSGNDRHATLYGSPTYSETETDSLSVTFTADVERVVQNDAYIKQIAQSLKVWLPFDESTTADKCGNEWNTYGTTSIGTTNAISGQALQLNKGYLRSAAQITFGGADFTVDFYGYMNSSSEAWAGFFCAQSTTNTGDNGRPGQINLHRNNSSGTIHCNCYNSSGTNLFDKALSGTLTNERHHFELDYSHAESTLRVFIDGQINLTQTVTLERLARYLFFGTNSYNPSAQRMVGTLDEFRLVDGVALHTANFTSPTAAEYEELAFQLDSHVSFTVDVERRISNVVEFTADVERKVINAWRYVNLGTANKLTVTGTTLENLSETKSVTGTAFYQTTRAKCFDLPATDEIWLKFDVYFDGSSRWRAYNGGANGITGVTAQTTNTIYFFSNGNEITGIANAAKKKQLQTVILHMVSGSSAGVIEAWVDGTKIHTYTGDVNHGEDFADIYLQSDGAGTFFSNVVISNRQLTQADGYQSFTADVERRTTKRIEFTVDVERKVNNVINVDFVADVEIVDFLPVTFAADVERRVTVRSEFTADVAIFDMIPVKFIADVMRSIIGKVKLYAGDNSKYFDGSSSGSELKPVVIPSQSLTDIGRSPVAPNNTNGLQSVEITIAEQQITENVHFVGNVPFDIMYPVRGQYLDYLIDMRVERVQKHGILYSCDCCSDIDEILYTQLAYTVPKTMTWNEVRSGETVEKKTHYPPASVHVQRIAAALGLQAVMQFEDFLSTVTSDDIGGATYADLIRELFGWSSRVPTQMINYFIRNGVLYIVQRGYEARLIDLSFTHHTIPTVTHDLVRMTWGATPRSKTETREQRRYNWNPEEYDYSDVYDPDEEETTPQDGGEETWVSVEDVSTGIDWVAWTTYQYYPKVKGFVEGSLPNVLGGLLAKVTTSKHSTNPDNPDSYTQITHRYNRDKQKVYTETYVHYRGGKDTPKDTRTVNTSRYITLPNGEQFLAAESSTSYEGRFIGDYPSKVVDSTSTTHSPGRQGQTHTIKFDSDGEIVGEVFGQDTGDDRVTPLSLDKAGSLENGKLTSYRYNGETGEWEKIGEWVEETTTEQRTLNGLSLYDSSFPVHGDSKLIEITEAIKWLNRRTKETVTMTIYEYPHLIDFNDRIIFEGNVYFLVSNTATTTERIFNEQRITITRWY